MFPQITDLPDHMEIRPEEFPITNFRTGEVTTETIYRIYTDGQRTNGTHYNTHEDAQRTALAMAEHAAAEAIIEDTVGQERHYGIQVWSDPHPTRSTPTWLLTDPHTGHDGFAFAWYSHTPPPVAVYTRDQYEAVCAALDLEAAPDSEFANGGNYGDRHAELSLFFNGARTVIEHTVRRRRIAGVKREEAGVRATARENVRAQAGEGPYTREQYETACTAAGVAPREDRVCLLVVEQAVVSASGSGLLVVDTQLPTDELETELAKRRGHGIGQARRENTPPQRTRPGGTCHNCGRRSADSLWERNDSSGIRGWVCTSCNRDEDVALAFA